MFHTKKTYIRVFPQLQFNKFVKLVELVKNIDHQPKFWWD